MFPVRWVLISSVFLFEAASALCGAAPDSAALIVGRAFAGVGAAGIFAGTVGATSMRVLQLISC